MHEYGLETQSVGTALAVNGWKCSALKRLLHYILRRRRHACLARLKHCTVANTSREINFTPTKWYARWCSCASPVGTALAVNGWKCSALKRLQQNIQCRRRHACLARLKRITAVCTSREINFTPTKLHARIWPWRQTRRNGFSRE